MHLTNNVNEEYNGHFINSGLTSPNTSYNGVMSILTMACPVGFVSKVPVHWTWFLLMVSGILIITTWFV